VEETLVDVEPVEPWEDEMYNATINVVQMPWLRHVIVRTWNKVDCYQMGFWCKPTDQDDILAALAAYNCSVSHPPRRAVSSGTAAARGIEDIFLEFEDSGWEDDEGV